MVFDGFNGMVKRLQVYMFTDFKNTRVTGSLIFWSVSEISKIRRNTAVIDICVFDEPNTLSLSLSLDRSIESIIILHWTTTAYYKYHVNYANYGVHSLHIKRLLLYNTMTYKMFNYLCRKLSYLVFVENRIII